MIDTGNERSNAYWEDGVPESYPIPSQHSSASEIMRFLRDKYELGQFKSAAPIAAVQQQVEGTVTEQQQTTGKKSGKKKGKKATPDSDEL